MLMPDGCCLCGSRDQITWNTIPVSEQKNTFNNLTLNNQTINRAKEITESNKKKTELSLLLPILRQRWRCLLYDVN
jgi:hypothetical protein